MGHRLQSTPVLAILESITLMAAITAPAHSQILFRRQSPCPPSCPPPCEPVSPVWPFEQPPAQQPPAQQPPAAGQPAPPPQAAAAQPPPAAEPSFGGEQFAALGGQSVNMIGDLLGAGRSVSFFYQRSKGSVFINGTGSTNAVNPKVADDNSPLPEDRVYFRYNYFNDALKVTGDSGQAVFDAALGLSKFSAPRFLGIPATRSYDVHDFTFGGEKTFGNGRFSVELRIPFSSTLAHSLDLSVAEVTGTGRDPDGDSSHSILQTLPTPGDTLGHRDTEFGNMAVILKGLACRTETLALSGGLAIGIPTASDTRVRVTDFLGDGSDNDVELQRLREFHVANDTWALSPFVAFLATPTCRFFTQGFLQVDVPLNKSRVTYSERALINTEPAELMLNPLFVSDHIGEQTLLQADLGAGWWLIKNRTSSWITGMAPTLELHYTTTLDNADILELPAAQKSPTLQVVGPGGQLIPEPNSTVGNLRNRLDILNLTVGNTFLIANRATMATGFAFPLRDSDNRTFSWEFLLQVNYYFGGSRDRPLRAPAAF
jgi:hypothetical protein